MERRVTRSTSNTRRDPEETEGKYWGRVIDLMTIERGQAEAIRTVQRATTGDPTALLNTTQNEQQEEGQYHGQPVNDNQRGFWIMDQDVPNNLLEEEFPFTSNLTNYTEQSSQILQAMRTAFVDNSPPMMGGVETVTTPVDMNISVMDGPLDPVFTRPSLQITEDMDLDTQPMRGPREQGNTTSDILDHFIDDNYGDVLRSSLLNQSSYMSLLSVKTSPPQAQPRVMAMDWYVPDGTNRRVVERKIADFCSPGGGTGALILTLTRLLLYYDTTKYLVDIDTGEVFGWITNQWCRTGLYCSPQPFIVSELTALTARCCAALKMDLEQEQQTSVIQLPKARGDNTVILPPLPLMPEPDTYVQQLDAMTPNMRRNYIRDRTQAALTYITEYETAQEWECDPQYDKQQVLQRLQIIYGKADQVKQRIDTALNNDDIHRRRRVMHPLGLPKRFPVPQNMKNCPIATWITWIRDESNELIAAIDEENVRRRDPDDPFDGTASGIFAPLQHDEEVHQQQNSSGIQHNENRVEVDESGNRNLQNGELQEGRLVDIQTPNLQHEDICEQMTTQGIEQRATPQPQESPREQQPDTSTSRTVGGSQTEQGENDTGAGHLPTNTSTYR